MKKWILFLLAAVMLLGTAFADAPVSDEAGVVKKTLADFSSELTLYSGEAGFTIKYPAELLTTVMKYSKDTFVPVGGTEESETYLMFVPAEVSPEDAEALLDEAVGGYGEEYLLTVREDVLTEQNVQISSVQAELDGQVDRFYLVCDEANVLCVTAIFQADAPENYDELFDAMLESLSFALPAAAEQ